MWNDGKHINISRRAVLTSLGAGALPAHFSIAQAPGETDVSADNAFRPVPRPGAPINWVINAISAKSETPELEIPGTHTLDDKAMFKALSVPNIAPGGFGGRELKFIITDVHKNAPQLHLMNTQRFAYHYSFVVEALKIKTSIEAFNRATYFSKNRMFLAGSILEHGSYGPDGVYALQFWPVDPVSFEHVRLTYDLARKALPSDMKLVFTPLGAAQEAMALKHMQDFHAQGIDLVMNADLIRDVKFLPLNTGQSVGRLKIMKPGKNPRLAQSDIPVFTQLPNDLTHVAGVISTVPQTPLSHVNLRARQNGIPNAYLKGATENPDILSLDGQPIRFSVSKDGYEIQKITESDLALYATVNQPNAVNLSRDLNVKQIAPLKSLRHKDKNAYGAKAANVAELKRALGRYVPDGFAVPYAHYDGFMRQTGLYDKIKAAMSTAAFQSSPDQRAKTLKAFRRELKQTELPPDIFEQISRLQKAFPAHVTPRCRSSANSEDMAGFTGAGLYDSFTHKADEGHLGKSIKQVWASLWNYRAFEERDFYGIDHFQAAMGVLVHPNFKNEKVNGVAVTRNIYFDNFRGFYLNSQIGEVSVTNPIKNARAEEMLILSDTSQFSDNKYEKIVLQPSSLANGPVMESKHLDKLILLMEKIHLHFMHIYQPKEVGKFAMDIEFKVTAENKLVVKQARPWV